MLLQVYTGVVSAVALAAALRLWSLRRFHAPRGPKFHAPSPDVNRYLVVIHHGGNTFEQYHGYDGLKARHAYEDAPMEAGCRVEFYEWGERRGSRSA